VIRLSSSVVVILNGCLTSGALRGADAGRRPLDDARTGEVSPPWLVCALAVGAVGAEPTPVTEIEVVGEQASLEDRSVAQLTVIEVDAQLPGSADVATAVSRAPGTTVLRLGGLGSFASVGIRGSAARQVEVLLDGVPLNPEGGAAVDLSELPLRAFERVEVYRGAAPAELGSAALGGVVNLVTGEGGTTAALSAGSWGSARASLTGGGSLPVGEVWAAADALTTSGRFRYLDDGGTRLVPDDDTLQVRENNDVRQVSAHGRWRVGPEEGLRVTVLDALLLRDQGIAGFTSAPTTEARYRVVRDLLSVEAEGTTGASRLRLRPWGLVRLEALDDPLAELGVGGPEARSDQATVAGLHGYAGWAVAAPLRLDGVVDLRTEQAASSGGAAGTDSRTRQVIRGTAAGLWSPAPGVRLTPAVAVLGLLDAAPLAARTDALVLPRIAGMARSGPVAVTATAGAFARPPDLLELFGDRGAVVGNPALRPERSLQGDLGLAWEHGEARIEAVAFHRRVTDLIALAQTAQGVARPENVELASVTGAEAAADAESDLAWAGTNVTVQRAVDRSSDPTYAGNQLPRVPVVAAGIRMGVTPGPVRAGWDFTWTAGTWLDRANFTQQAPRPLLGVTAAVRDRTGAWWVEVDVRNVADRIVQPALADPLLPASGTVDRPVEDLLGFPLPGRTAWLTVRWTP
jgi:iron complex outermembrane receptor protein